MVDVIAWPEHPVGLEPTFLWFRMQCLNPFNANVPFLNHLQTFSRGIEIGNWCEKGKTTKLLSLSDFEINRKVFGEGNEEYFASIWRIKFQFSSEWYFLYCTQFLRLGKLLLYFEYVCKCHLENFTVGLQKEILFSSISSNYLSVKDFTSIITKPLHI